MCNNIVDVLNLVMTKEEFVFYSRVAQHYVFFSPIKIDTSKEIKTTEILNKRGDEQFYRNR